MTTRYTITTRSGVTVTGVVQGAGGMLTGMGGIAVLKGAAAGHHGPLNRVAHVVPEHCIVYPEFSAKDNGPAVPVEILGAKVVIAST